MTDRRERLVRVAAAIAARDPERLEEALLGALDTASPAEIEEVLLQSYLFVGFPAVINAFSLWRDLPRSPRGGGTGAGGQRGREEATAGHLSWSDPTSWEEWRSRGEKTCRRVYGTQYERLRENVRRLHPDLEGWMLVEGYGKVLGRPALDLPDRELCIVALLVVLDVPRQLHSHLKGAIAVGVPEADVRGAIGIASGYADPAARDRAVALWEAVTGGREG